MTIYNTDLYLNFWNNPYRYADIVDILENRGRAWAFFQDLLVNRPTEFSAFIRLYLIASRNLDEKRLLLTARQNEAIRYAREAVQRNVHPTRYVAEKLGGITHRAVQRLIKRASARVESEMFAISALHPVIDISGRRSSWYPSESEIKAQIAHTERICAGCGTTMHTGRYALCWECGERFGHTREEWIISKRPGEPAPAWLLPEARRIDHAIRNEAINELFRERGFDNADGEDFEDFLELRAAG